MSFVFNLICLFSSSNAAVARRCHQTVSLLFDAPGLRVNYETFLVIKQSADLSGPPTLSRRLTDISVDQTIDRSFRAPGLRVN